MKKTLYAIKFYVENGTLFCRESVPNRSNKMHDESLCMFHFGKELANTELLDFDSKRSLKSFCEGWLAGYRKTDKGAL